MIPGVVAGGVRKAELPQYLAAAHASGGFSVWPISPAGFGAKLASPATTPSGEGLGIAFSPSNKSLVVTSRTGNGLVHAYPFSQKSGLIGVRFAVPPGLSGTYAYKPGFHPDGGTIAIPMQDGAAVKAYIWSDSLGFGAAFSDPLSYASVGAGNCAKFTPSGDACFLWKGGLNGTIQSWAWSSMGFGAKFASPSLVPASARDGVFTADSVIVSHTTYPYISEWVWSSAGFGAARASPVTPPPNESGFGDMNKSKTAFVFANSGSGDMSPAAYNYTTSGIGGQILKADGLPSNGHRAAAFNKSGDMVAFSYSSSPFVQVNSFSSGAFGAKLSPSPDSLPPAAVNIVAFTN